MKLYFGHADVMAILKRRSCRTCIECSWWCWHNRLVRRGKVHGLLIKPADESLHVFSTFFPPFFSPDTSLHGGCKLRPPLSDPISIPFVSYPCQAIALTSIFYISSQPLNATGAVFLPRIGCVTRVHRSIRR